jgi:hypothetical protein
VTDYKISGVHPIRRVIWSLLKNELGWDAANYNGAVPVVTPQEQPELNYGEYPYVIYNYSFQPSGVNHLIKEEQATFVIHGPKDSEIRAALNLIDSYFSSYDDSANYVNWWIEDHGSDNYKRFNFKWIRVVTGSGAGPTEQEAGSQDAYITLRYQYTEQGNPSETAFVTNSVIGRPTPPA